MPVKPDPACAKPSETKSLMQFAAVYNGPRCFHCVLMKLILDFDREGLFDLDEMLWETQMAFTELVVRSEAFPGSADELAADMAQRLPGLMRTARAIVEAEMVIGDTQGSA